MLLFKQIFGTVYMEEAEAATTASVGAPTLAPVTQAPEEPTVSKSPEESTKESPKEAQSEEGTGWDAIKGEFEGKPAVSMAINFVAETGISLEDPAVVAVLEDGDYTMIRAKLAAMGVQGYEPMLAILEGESQAYLEEKAQREQTDVANVQHILGEGHEEIWAWAKETMSESEKGIFNGLLEVGGDSAIIAAVALGAIYEKKFEGSTPAASLSEKVATGSSSVSGGLSRQEFAAEVEKLAKSTNGNPFSSPEYAKLQARRALSRSRGM